MPDTQPGLDALERMRRAYERGASIEDLVRLIDAALASPATGDSRPEDHMLFHGHHPACPWTVEGDWSVCDCGASRGDSRQSEGLREDEPGLLERSHRLARGMFGPHLHPGCQECAALAAAAPKEEPHE